MTPPPPGNRRWLAPLLLGCLALLIGAATIPVVWIGRSNWLPVEAEVDATRIQRTRPGTPAWSLMADFHYEVGGERYEQRQVDVFHDADRDVTSGEREAWPDGTRFTVYYREGDPQWCSLSPDGDFEAAAGHDVARRGDARGRDPLRHRLAPKGR